MTTITVRYRTSTYTATAQGKRASCTAGPDQAAQALARKLVEYGTAFELRRVRPCHCDEAGQYELVTEAEAA
jgi:hypothetical protein